MAEIFNKITPELARNIKFIVADVDGTLITIGDNIGAAVSKMVRELERNGIMVGLASGRTLPRLDPLALNMKISGPVIAENGGVARLKVGNLLVNLGYSNTAGLGALQSLLTIFPDKIKKTQDNQDRQVDVAIYSDGIRPSELNRYVKGVQILDSGYMVHLLPDGVSKGATLRRILPDIGNKHIQHDEVMVFGDSATDASLFETFVNSVLIINPKLELDDVAKLKGIASYCSELDCAEGFLQVCEHILRMRK